MELNSADIVENEMILVEIDNKAVIVTRFKGEIVAFSARCPHAAGNLFEGTLRKGRISCPTHGWKFELRSGRSDVDADCRLRKYRVIETSGRVTVEP